MSTTGDTPSSRAPAQPQDRVRAILTSKVEPPMRLVLVALADRMNNGQLVCWPSVEDVAKRTGYCERQARDILNALEARGIIRRVAGEHRSRDITIEWSALEVATAEPESRGGRRVPAKIAAHPAKIAAQNDRQRLPPTRQSLPPQPAKIATLTGKDCPRSDKEAIMEATSEATSPLKAPQGDPPAVAGSAPAPTYPTWLPKAPDRPALLAAVLGCVEELRQAPVNPARCATDAREVLGLWSATGKPPPAEFAADLRLVIRAARACPHRLFARDIRAEGWAEGTDRQRSLATICRRDRWGERLEVARAWEAGSVDVGASQAARTPTPTRAPTATNSLVADALARLRRTPADAAPEPAPRLILTGDS